MATTFRGFEMPEEVEEIGVDKDEILLSLVGKVGIESMKTHSQKHQQLRERLSGIESSNVEECSRLKANLETFHAERELVAQRMEELRRAMKQLEDDDAELCMRIEETEMQISELDANCDEEASKLTRELEETEKVVDFEASVDGLADGLKVYEESLKQAVTVSNIFENCENVNEFVPSKLGVYLVHVKNYFASESECIDFLRQRVGSLEKEARDLVSFL
jgi:chromosome segregation ATPase